MNKKAIIPLLLCSALLSGCSVSNYFSTSSVKTAVLHEEAGTVLRSDVASGKYADIMLPSYITDLWVTKNDVLNNEFRTLATSDETTLVYSPACNANDSLCDWIKSSNCTFTFRNNKNFKENPAELFVSTYTVRNYNQNSTFEDYLSVMSALSQYYGECTIELYKNGGSVVSISDMQQAMDTDEIIEELSSSFDLGSLTLHAQWINKAYNLTVNFNSPSDCSITYSLNF